MEVALRRRLEGVADIHISQQRQHAEVVFLSGGHRFEPGEFRAAVGEADVEVLHFEIDACGRFELEGSTTWFVAPPNRFRVADAPPAGSRTTCVTADLEDGTNPGLLHGIRPLAAGR